MIEIKTVQQISRFAGCSLAAQRWLADRFIRKEYPRGASIFHEGEEALYFRIIESGVVKVLKTLESGKELILCIFHPGDSIAEIPLIDGIEYPATGVVVASAKILTLSREDYINMSSGLFPEIALGTIRDLSCRIRSLSNRLQELGGGKAESRLAHVLLAFGNQGKDSLQGQKIPFHLTRQELASMVGVRMETVIRIMSKWNKEGIVKTFPEGFLLVKPNYLHEIAEI